MTIHLYRKLSTTSRTLVRSRRSFVTFVCFVVNGFVHHNDTKEDSLGLLSHPGRLFTDN